MPIQFIEGESKRLDVSLNPVPIQPASLSGQVVDADTSGPISGVLVQVIDLVSTTTSSDGTYSITNIPPGTYTVRFSHTDYETVEY